MNVLNWVNNKSKNLKWYHLGALKVCIASGVLLLAKFIPELLTLDWYWYAIIFAVTYAITLIGWFGNSNS